MSRPRVLLLAGYFDWFSGYQETGLAAWLSRYATTEVVAGDRVSPMFSDAQLAGLGVPRRYATGTTEENGVRVTRFSTVEKRSMVWSTKARSYIESQEYDLIVQVMPGQLLPLAGTLARNRATRVALYGDNSAMWSHLPLWKRALKGAAFAVSKGMLYTFVNARANEILGYTPNTVTRLKPFAAGKKMKVLPLTFDAERFHFDPEVRSAKRRELGYHEDDVVLVAAGKIQQKKRLDLLLRAIANLAPSHPRLKLLLTGLDGSAHAGELTRQVAEDSVLSERVKLIGFVDTDELNRVFNAADIGVWPRMPAITIQQAMGTGLKVAIPRNEWVSHLIKPGTGSYFADGEDDETSDMERAIVALAVDGTRIDERVARAAANSWLSADRVVRSLLDGAGVGG